MLDEVDKVGADWRGDPSSALLEVLDPAQNHSFRDHYLDVELDLSEVLFIATANVVDTIPGPLLDRMEVIALDGYTEDEKLAIAKGYLVPRQTERNGLHEGEVEVSEDAVRSVIGDYTREAGVRNLERELGKVLRKAAAPGGRGSRGHDHDRARRPPGRPGAPALPPRGGRAHGDAGRGHRAGGHRSGRRRPLRGGQLHAGRRPGRAARADRPAGRRHARVGADRAVLHAGPPRGARRGARRAPGPGDPPARPGRRGAQGRALRRA